MWKQLCVIAAVAFISLSAAAHNRSVAIRDCTINGGNAVFESYAPLRHPVHINCEIK